MDESIFDKFYEKLVACLPMDDANFRASLKTAGLLPGDLKSAVTLKSTSRAEKAEHFLDHGINNNIDNFSKLLRVMENSKRDELKVLVSEIREESIPGCIEPDVIPPTAKKAKVEICVLDEVQKNLKTAYNRLCYSDHPLCYTQLAMVRDEMCNIRDQKLNEITKHTLQGQVDEILKIKEPLETLDDVFHYNDLPCPRLLLVLGAPGIGKTTFANEICLKWAKDTECFLSNDYDLVILIRLRAIQERALQQAMIDTIGSEAAYDELLTKSHGNRCLIILEGLDEISAHWQQNDTMFCQLVKTTTFLSHANILVTSRPHACIDLHKDIKDYTRKIEIVGFGKSQIKKHAESHFHNPNTAEKFMVQINNYSHISSLCYVPLCLNMVLECFKYNNGTLHTTLTELYQSFIVSKVDEHIHFKKAISLGTILDSDEQCLKNLATVLSSVPNVLSKGALKTMFLLSKLAHKSYFEWYDKPPKIVYTNKDLADCNITNLGSDACGLLKATNTLFATGNTAVYTFNHLSVQEYFCALYISLLPEDQQLQLLKDHITDYPHLWPFYAGITKLRSSKASDHLHQLLLQHKIDQLSYSNVTLWNGIYAVSSSICTGLNSIYEAQHSNIINKQESYSLFLSYHRLLPYDCLCISYFMSFATIEHLHLQQCNIGDHEAEVLARYKIFTSSLKMVDLSGNNFTCKGMFFIIVNIIQWSTNLTHFSIAGNPICDDGINKFVLLQLHHIIQLDIRNIKMTNVGAYALSEYLKLNNSLESLEIGGNDIYDNGLTKVLNNLTHTLVRLIISDCHLTSNDAIGICKMLRINKSLKHLEISKNPIGDDGIKAISDSLHVNSTLIQLMAYCCNFHDEGAKSIAEMLQKNNTLKYLDISLNVIGHDGMAAISHGLHTNSKLIANRALIKLRISYDDFEDDVIKALLKVYVDCNLIKLSISRVGSREAMIERLNQHKSVFTCPPPLDSTDDVTIKDARTGITDPMGSSEEINYWKEQGKHGHSMDHAIECDSDSTEEWLIDDYNIELAPWWMAKYTKL